MAETNARRPMSSLTIRMASGLPLAVAVVLVIALAPLWSLSIVLALVAGLAMYEYSRMTLPGPWDVQAILGLALAGAMPLLALAGGAGLAAGLVLAALAGSLAPMAAAQNNTGAWANASFRSWGVVYCGGLFACLLLLAGLVHGRALLLFAIFCVVAADVGAYFVGHLLGKHKLAPSISPGKTIEGALGGAAAAALLGGLFTLFWLPDTPPALGALLGLLLAVCSVGGDLLESSLKRSAGVKDSGGILPGHGGVLDRVDGILPASAVFLLIRVLWWQ